MALPEGYRRVALDHVDSTNREAVRRIEDGYGHGTVVRAETQSAGRGRRGREWLSPPGNLYASVVLSLGPPGTPAGQLAFIAGLAAAEALADIAPVRLKWPNDLLLHGRKLGGILIETARGLAVVGIGVNLVSAPKASEFPATSLKQEGVAPPMPDDLLARICWRLEGWCVRWRATGFAQVREAWLDRAEGLGQRVEARLPGRTVAGRFSGLDADGGLMLETQDGGVEIIAAGDVFFGAGNL